MKWSLEQRIRERAGHLCEYCHFPESLSRLRFTLDHITARQHGGENTAENLALCCPFCNKHKGPNVAGIDPQTKVLTPLFNPRHDQWRKHFRWAGATLVGTTAVGRVTIHVLAMNHSDQLLARRSVMAQGVDLA